MLNWKLFLLMLLLLIGGCGIIKPLCGDQIKTEKASPDLKYTATVYERDCGATTDFSTIVNLRERSTKFNGDELGPVVIKGQHSINLDWDGNTRLRLQCRDCRPEEIFKQERRWKDVEISLGR